jgi:hypothetical protein
MVAGKNVENNNKAMLFLLVWFFIYFLRSGLIVGVMSERLRARVGKIFEMRVFDAM